MFELSWDDENYSHIFGCDIGFVSDEEAYEYAEENEN